MASVNKVILVGSVGRLDLYRAHSELYARTLHALNALDDLIAMGKPDVATLRDLALQLRPFFNALARVGHWDCAFSLDELRQLCQGRDRLLQLLELVDAHTDSLVRLHAAQMRSRALACSDRQLPRCANGLRSRTQARAAHARYALFRFAHFLPASAALIALG